MPKQFRDEHHRAAVEGGRDCGKLRSRFLAAVHRYANTADPTEAEAVRLQSMALARALLVAERARVANR